MIQLVRTSVWHPQSTNQAVATDTEHRCQNHNLHQYQSTYYSRVEGTTLATGGVQSSVQGCSVYLQSPEWHRTCIYRCNDESVYFVTEISALVIKEADSTERSEDAMG